MSDPRYAGIGPVEVRVMEEAAELIQAISKAVRFGWEDWHPETGVVNRLNVGAEMRDLIKAWNELAEAQGIARFYPDPS